MRAIYDKILMAAVREGGKSMKKIILFLLAAIMVCCGALSLVGCGGKADSWDVSAAKDGSVTAQVEMGANGYDLIITGNGPMKDFVLGEEKPWAKYSIKNLFVRGGVTYLGKNAFLDLGNVTEVTLPEAVTAIGEGALRGDVTIYANASSVEGGDAYEGLYLYSESAPADGGRYWHYVDGKKVLWERSKVMLIGGGFAAMENIGAFVEGLSAAANAYVDVDVVGEKGTLVDGYTDFNSGLGGEISALLAAEKYQVVAIMFEGDYAYANFRGFTAGLKTLVDKIAESEDGVKIYLCQPWGYAAQNGVTADGMELLLRQAYGQAATVTGAKAVYAGMAMSKYDKAQDTPIFGQKEISDAGAYITAAILTSTAYDSDLDLVKYTGGLDDGLAEALLEQGVAVAKSGASLSYPVHNCENACPTCGKCLDDGCTNVACYAKCGGHQLPHTCESPCAKCGGCLDATCVDVACIAKCTCSAAPMARIDINTADGSNAWATQYSRWDKLAGLIDYVDSTVSVSNCDDAYALTDVACEVKVRGNYTLEYEKKPIRLKFNKKQKMLGMNDDAKCKSWVLLAEWKDLAMQNNATTMFLADKILGTDGYYATEYRYVQVYLNNQYWGVYLLVDQQQVNEYRIDIGEPDDDYTGVDIGYFFEFDGYYTEEDVNKGGDYTFATNFGSQKGYTIKNDIYSMDQVNFLKNYLNNLYKLITSAKRGTYYKFNDTYTSLVSTTAASAKDAVAPYIDLQSLVDMYILSEIACDPDIAWSSFYLNVDMSPTGDKTLRFEAPWDFDSAYGIRSGYMNNATGLYAANSGNPWLSVFANEAWFTDMVKAKWASLMEMNLLEITLQNIDNATTVYAPYFVANYQRWINRLNAGNGELIGQLNSYKNPQTARQLAAAYHKNWLTTRLTYLNTVWGEGTIDDGGLSDVEGTSYYYEAEKASFGTTIKAKTGYGSRSNGYLGNVADTAGNYITFTVNAASAGKCALYAGVSKRNGSYLMSSLFSLKVNASAVNVVNSFIPAPGAGEEEWHTWTEVPVAVIELKAGENTITFTTNLSDGTNFDYVKIVSPVALS